MAKKYKGKSRDEMMSGEGPSSMRDAAEGKGLTLAQRKQASWARSYTARNEADASKNLDLMKKMFGSRSDAVGRASDKLNLAGAQNWANQNAVSKWSKDKAGAAAKSNAVAKAKARRAGYSL